MDEQPLYLVSQRALLQSCFSLPTLTPGHREDRDFMAKIFPFRALRYSEKLPLSEVVTQPYDKISPEMQDRYYSASPYNLVRIILGKAEPGDDDHSNVYSRAAENLERWRQEGVLLPDREPSLYRYTQTFRVPGAPDGATAERRGFIALGQLEDYENHVVFRHEQTLSKPKTDRLNLLRATEAHAGQLFMLYSDPAGKVDSALEASAPPTMEVIDEYGVVHRVWKISDPDVIAAVQAEMADKKLIIADGHHRYETALNYRNEKRAKAQSQQLTDGASGEDAPYERVMMTFVNMDSPGLVILPTHRVVFGLENFVLGDAIRRVRDYFHVEDLTGRADLQASSANAPRQGTISDKTEPRVANAPRQGTTSVVPNRPAHKDPSGRQPAAPNFELEKALELLREAGRESTALLAVASNAIFLLRAKASIQSPLLNGLSERQQALDVVKLHKLILEGTLGMSEEDIRAQKHLKYVREAGDAKRLLDEGANVAFLMNPVPIEQMRDVAFAGEVMPQKSTDFYPKLLSGLTIYSLDVAGQVGYEPPAIHASAVRWH
jgi:uncharacterized protein (DUF1015 family)